MRAKTKVTDGVKIWPAVNLDRLKQEMWDILDIVDDVYQECGYEEADISAGCEVLRKDIIGDFYVRFIHKLNSLHYTGYALDFSFFGVKETDRVFITSELKDRLSRISKKYQVIYHNGHLHIEYDWRIK